MSKAAAPSLSNWNGGGGSDGESERAARRGWATRWGQTVVEGGRRRGGDPVSEEWSDDFEFLVSIHDVVRFAISRKNMCVGSFLIRYLLRLFA